MSKVCYRWAFTPASNDPLEMKAVKNATKAQVTSAPIYTSASQAITEGKRWKREEGRIGEITAIKEGE